MLYNDQTLAQTLRTRAQNEPDKIVYRFLEGATETAWTFGELELRSRGIASALMAKGLTGERVGLVFAPGLDFMAALWGCLCAGVIPVPVYPAVDSASAARLTGIMRDAGAKMVLTTAELVSKTRLLRWTDSGLRKLTWLPVDKMKTSDVLPLPARATDLDAVAFLQYTSGSTAEPKGVMVTQRNLLNNAYVSHLGAAFTDATVIMGWIPLYHDMGLIGNVLQAVYSGVSYVGMSPLEFLRHPYNFLAAVSRYRGAASAMPNFGFELAMRKITPAQRETLDLSSWTSCLNGAEAVRLDTLQRFQEMFEPHGLRPGSLRATYGLAEATLMVTLGDHLSPIVTFHGDPEAIERHEAVALDPADARARPLVGCGKARPGQIIAIVNPETERLCSAGQIGEIWLAGPSVCAGYWGKEELTKEVFEARIVDQPDTRYMRTGDLGFLQDGELFVTGRTKDLIVIRGRNLYPQDIELSVSRADEGLRPGCCAALGIELEGEERLVVVAEVRRDFDSKRAPEVIAAIKRCVLEDTTHAPFAVKLLAAGSILKTSSGKLRRRAIATAYRQGKLKTAKGVS